MSKKISDQFNILSLSGGGFKGLFTAKFLEEFENKTGKPIYQSFDLICGTSIGGIIAMALGLGIPAKKIVAILEKNGKHIFPIKYSDCHLISYMVNWLCSFFVPKYSNKGLVALMQGIFEENKLGASKSKLLVTSVNYSNGKAQFFKTRHHTDYVNNDKIKMADIAMATSAAPTFFPIWKNTESTAYLDGGLVANSPSLAGIHEAQHVLKRNQDSINLLSISTSNCIDHMKNKQKFNEGILYWGRHLFDTIIAAQEELTHDTISYRYKDSEGTYVEIKIPSSLTESNHIDLDEVNAEAITDLKSNAVEQFMDFDKTVQAESFIEHQSEKFIPLQ